jgi:hypothetical protein
MDAGEQVLHVVSVPDLLAAGPRPRSVSEQSLGVIARMIGDVLTGSQNMSR